MPNLVGLPSIPALCRIPADLFADRDDNEAIDKSNIVEGRTRHAQPEGGSYREPGDDEGLPTDD